MKVQELIDLLEQYDPQATVMLMTQQHWPFETEIHGVMAREEIPAGGGHPDEREGDPAEGTDPTDVFIVEGDQLRYGSQNAWGEP
jgi:hypothetical protein